MQISGNIILITGGGTGIGRALAEALQAEGNQVVIAGRRQAQLDETIAANPGMKAITLDITDEASIRDAVAQLKTDVPGLNVVIHNAGIMRLESVLEDSLATMQATLATNLVGPIVLTAALLPQLLSQPAATIVTVSSGLAFLPLAGTPTYCATKAAIHSYTQSLRYQLRATTIKVLEIIPPYVQTELMSPDQASDPNAMGLQAFIDETISILKNSPEATEICVERVKPLRFAETNGGYDAFYSGFNAAMAAH